MTVNNNEHFAIAELFERPSGIYALAHSVGPLCKRAKIDLNTHFIEPWETLGGDAWPTWLAQIERFKDQLAILLNGNTDDFCPQPSVSLAFSQWLAAVSKQRPSMQRRVVVMHEDAFASLGFAVQGLCKTYGLELSLLGSGANDLDSWESALSQKNVFACLITHAHSNTGELSDVCAISKLAKQYNVLCAVDIAQSVGIIPIDVQQWSSNCIVGSCVKWLSGGPGAAFLYIPSEQAATLSPEHLAWFSHENPFEFDIRHFAPAHGVMRFWGGTPSIAPYTMAASAIGEHNRFGTARFRHHNLMLMRQFLAQYPFEIPQHYSHLLSLPADLLVANINNDDMYNGLAQYSSKHSATLCLKMPELEANHIKRLLSTKNVKFDERNSMVRLSFSAINTSSDIDNVLACYGAE